MKKFIVIIKKYESKFLVNKKIRKKTIQVSQLHIWLQKMVEAKEIKFNRKWR